MHPNPPLKIESPHLSQVEDLILKLQLATRPLWMPLLPTNLLNDHSRTYFEETRKERIGMPLSEYGQKEGGEKCWENAEPVARELGNLLKSNGGPFIDGNMRKLCIRLLNMN